MTDRLHNHMGSLFGFFTSTLGVITANQEQVEWWLRCSGSVVAIVAGGLTIRSLLRKK